MESLSPGRTYTLTQNTAYALPPRRVLINLTNNPTTLEQSNNNSTWVATTADDDENVESSAQFIRSTGVDTIISLKAA